MRSNEYPKPWACERNALNSARSPDWNHAPGAAEAEVHAEPWRCIKIRSRRSLRRRGRDCLPCEELLITARRPVIISIGGFAVHDVADAGILWAFCCVVDTLSEQCRRRRPGANPLVVAIFRINRRAAERSSATCQRRRSPCPLGFPGDGLEITAVLGTG